MVDEERSNSGKKLPPDQLEEAVTGISSKPSTTRTQGQSMGLLRPRRGATPAIVQWNVIQCSSQALSFENYKAFMDYVMCWDRDGLKRLFGDTKWIQRELTKYDDLKGARTTPGRRYLPFTDPDAYRLLKVASEAFLMLFCPVPLSKEELQEDQYKELLNMLKGDNDDVTAEAWWRQYLRSTNGYDSYLLPYLSVMREKLKDAPIKDKIFKKNSPRGGEPGASEAKSSYGILQDKLANPCMLELIWSYWYEEGMLVQTMNVISRRFQNLRGPAENDPLARIEIDPLRPLNNLLKGFVQDEQHRLSVQRRAYEYDHHYGLTLKGKAVSPLRSADSRSRFLEAFHQLLYLATAFFKQDDDTTVVADGYPLLSDLRNLHLILSEGAHNQFGDLPSTARIEMLMQQWILSRPEFRELLSTRPMAAYPEPWMDRVDAMKKLQGWGDTSVLHFHELGVHGEQILLGVRCTEWNEIEDAEMAALWARSFRNQIQGYIHAYRTVTGVDLTSDVTTP